jgi:hypothetical protein
MQQAEEHILRDAVAINAVSNGLAEVDVVEWRLLRVS